MPRLSAILTYPIAATALLLAATLTSGPTCATELYKWTDANGIVHYSDSPPQGATSAKRVRLNGTESPPTPEPKPEPASADAATKPQPAQATLPDTPENRKRLCEQAQSQVEMLQSKFQIADSSGKPLDDKARADRTAEAKRAATTYCH
ncbi:MAG: DUF4124 domain-containing protein [Proteobacteria bacterium]|nr:DUF4124 domain-containing protein [Pseudomonadota bacterium]